MKLPTVIESPTRRYNVKGLIASGDLSEVYSATYANGGGDNHVDVKVTRKASDNDLTTNEAAILGFMRPQPDTTDLKLRFYLPKLIDSFVSTDGLRVNVFGHDGESDFEPRVTLESILRAYPKGLNFRDMVWMYKRLLVAIGYTHSKGVIHGGVLPPHVLVHPTGHGAKLIDWTSALNFAALVKPKDPDPKAKAPAPHKAANAWEKLLEDPEYDPDPVGRFLAPAVNVDPNKMYVRVVSVPWEKFYAPEIWTKKTPTPATDIFMAAKCAVALMGGDVETNQIPDTAFDEPEKQRTAIQAFLASSLLQDARKRPFDAWELHESFDKLLLGLVGKPRYRPLAMPPAN